MYSNSGSSRPSTHSSSDRSSRPNRAPRTGGSFAGRGPRPSHSGGFTPERPARVGGHFTHAPRPSRDGYARPSSGGYQGRSGGFSRGASRGGGSRYRHQEMTDLSRFIHKAVEPVEAEPAYVPKHAFADFAVGPKLQASIIAHGYVTPSPIQDQSIPVSLEGHDVVGIANTGTGKTAAFLIPLIEKVLRNPSERVLIMAPTRELATQIASEFRSFAAKLPLHSVICVGGMNIHPQVEALRHKPAFVIGTPGRLKDLIERRSLSLDAFSSVVLDEADRMLDMGFINDMRYLLGLMPKEHQTLCFSATLSPEIEALIGQFMHEPVMISVRKREVTSLIDQDVVRVAPGQNKLDVLHDLLIQPGFDKVIIFGRTKHGVERLANTLVERGIRAESIHGDKTQNRRDRALDLFKRDHVQVLVATDVAARGIDVSGISHVINYDLPATHDDYIHRIGRTGRAGKKGIALTFVE